MSNPIHVTEDHVVQLEAAKALSKELRKLDVNHAFIGGFALALYGGYRVTSDIDILIETSSADVRDHLRPEITRLNRHFQEVGLKYYFSPKTIGELDGEALVRANDGNVLVETLPTKFLGLPAQASPIFPWAMTTENGDTYELPVLHPSTLILTKIKRWATIYQSTRPKSMEKAENDQKDICFLLRWLTSRNLKISFTAYNSDNPQRLYAAVKAFLEFLKSEAMDDEQDSLEKVLGDEDWEKVHCK